MFENVSISPIYFMFEDTQRFILLPSKAILYYVSSKLWNNHCSIKHPALAYPSD
jgi:hypothetical protein